MSSARGPVDLICKGWVVTLSVARPGYKEPFITTTVIRCHQYEGRHALHAAGEPPHLEWLVGYGSSKRMGRTMKLLSFTTYTHEVTL